MRGSLLALSFAAFSLGWLVFFGAGVRIGDWNATLLILGATALFYWAFRTGQTPPRLRLWHAIALWALPAYALFQLVPLPPSILGMLSPARSVIAGSLGGALPALTACPISLVPPLALLGFFSLLGYLTTFGLLRDIGWRFVESHPWAPVVPLVAMATVEAIIGISQWLISGNSNAQVTGTLSSGEHFACLLEIALPFTLIFGFISFRRHQAQPPGSLKPALLAAGSWTASLLLLLALLPSSSAASRLVLASSLFTLLCLGVIPRLKTIKLRWYGAGIAAGAVIAAVLLLMPSAGLTDSLAHMGATGPSEPKADTRLSIWSNSATLASEFRWFGTAPGGFEPAFLKYQGSADLNRISNSGNDVLDLLITFGTVGFAIVLIALAGVLRPALVGAVLLSDEPRRLLAAAITASFLGVILRSGLEANLSVPAIAMAFAWVAGLSQSSGLE